jgi:hypothetical protein
MGAEIGRESKTQDPLGLLIGLIPGRNGVQVGLGGGTTAVGLIVVPDACLYSFIDLK